MAKMTTIGKKVKSIEEHAKGIREHSLKYGFPIKRTEKKSDKKKK